MSAELVATAVAAARAGAEVLNGYFRAAPLRAEAKARNDFVSQADRDSEAAILALIRRRHPDHHVLAEESGALPGGSSELTWVVDPLDGTTNFLEGLPVWAVSVACCRGSVPVAAAILDPQGGNLFRGARDGGADWNEQRLRISGRSGLRGAFLATGFPFRARGALDVYLEVFRAMFLEARAIRRCGAAAIDLAYTAAGVYDGFFEFRLSAWDVAAGALLIREAGGVVSDLDGGTRFLTTGNVLAGSAGVHADLRAVVAPRVDEAEMDRLVPRTAIT